jgi:hypothetical protein
MKKFMVTLAAVLLSNTVLASDSFFYFEKTIDGTYHYTRILRCDSSVVNSDSTFTGAVAVGPFNGFQEAETSRNNALNKAKFNGVKVLLSEGVCTK